MERDKALSALKMHSQISPQSGKSIKLHKSILNALKEQNLESLKRSLVESSDATSPKIPAEVTKAIIEEPDEQKRIEAVKSLFIKMKKQEMKT